MFLTTKLFVLFLCFVKYNHGDDWAEARKSELLHYLDAFANGTYTFIVGQNLSVYNPEESKEKNYKIHLIDGYSRNNCLGLTTDASETIILQCPGKTPERPDCFDILTPKAEPRNKTAVPSRQIQKSCVRTAGPYCVGVQTPLKHMVLLKCRPSSTVVPEFGIRVPPNGPPPRQ